MSVKKVIIIFSSVLLMLPTSFANTIPNKVKKLNFPLGTPVVMTWNQLQSLSLENREKYLLELREALANPFADQKTSYEIKSRGNFLISILLGELANANDRDEQSKMLDRFEAITRELAACGTADATNETVSSCRRPLIMERTAMRNQWDSRWSGVPRTREAVAAPTERTVERERVIRPTRGTTAQTNGTSCTFEDRARSGSAPGVIKDGTCVKAENGMDCFIDDDASKLGKFKDGKCERPAATGGNCMLGGIVGKYNSSNNTCDVKKDFTFCGVKHECDSGKAICNPVLYGFDLGEYEQTDHRGAKTKIKYGNFPDVKTYVGENRFFGVSEKRQIHVDTSSGSRKLMLELVRRPIGPKHEVYNKPICVPNNDSKTVDQLCWEKAKVGHDTNTYSSTRAFIDMIRQQQNDTGCTFEGKTIQAYWNDWAKEVNDTCKNSVITTFARDYQAQVNALNAEQRSKHYSCLHVYDRARRVTQTYRTHAREDAVARPVHLNNIDSPVRSGSGRN